MHGIVVLCAVMPVYLTTTFVTTQLAIAAPYYHDTIPLYSEYAVYAIPALLLFSIAASIVTKPNYDVLCKRLALMYLLKGIAQIITISPQPAGAEQCKDDTFWTLRACADMMFSGHTAFVYLVLYKCKYRYFITFTMAFELVMADWHYAVDCFIAVIAGYAVEEKIIIESYL